MGEAFDGVDPRVQCVPAVNKSIFRINRDIRFSQDKSPYKTYSDMFFWIGDDPEVRSRATSCASSPRGSGWACGAHSLVARAARAAARRRSWRPASGGEFERMLGELEADGYEIGERGLVRVPAGFSADAPRADLLRLTVVHAIETVTPAPPEFESAAFVDWCLARFVRVKPLVDWLVDNIG